MELIRRSQASNRRAINYATEKLKATFQHAKALYAIRLGRRVHGSLTELLLDFDTINVSKHLYFLLCSYVVHLF